MRPVPLALLAVCLALPLAAAAQEHEEIHFSCDMQTKICSCTLTTLDGVDGCRRMQASQCAQIEGSGTKIVPTCDFSKSPVECTCLYEFADLEEQDELEDEE